jgi:flagellar FliL protein
MRDAVLTLLSTKTLQDIQDLQGKNRLKEDILAALARVSPAGKIKHVYFTDFMIQ